MKSRPITLRSLLISVFILVAVVADAIVGLPLIHAARGYLKADAFHEIESAARYAAASLDHDMAERMNDVILMSTRTDLATGDVRARQRIIEDLRQSNPDYVWVGLVRPDGTIIAGSSDHLVGSSVAGRSWFEGGLQGPFAGDVHSAVLLSRILPRSETDEELRLVDVAAPIRDADGKVVMVLGAHVNWRWARDVVQGTLAGKDASRDTSIFIVDKNNEVIEGPSYLKGAQLSLSVLKDESKASAVETWTDGKSYLTAAARSKGRGIYKGLDWTVVVRTNEAAAMAPVRDMIFQFLQVFFAETVLVVVLAWGLSRWISRPLETIAHASRADAEAGFALAHQSGRYAEVATLTSSLDRLMGEVMAGRNEVRALVDGLEQKVKDRTRDLSEEIARRKSIEEAIRVSEKRFRAVVENAGDAIYIHDRYGVISDVNRVACVQTGYAHDELIGMSVARLDAGTDFDNLRETWDLGEADPAKYPLTLETAHRRKDGSVFPIEVRISLLPTADGTRFVAMVRDITARKLVEEELVEAKKNAESANKAKSEFLSRMSHELRTPLNAVLGFAQLMEYNPKEPLTPTQVESVSRILSGGQHLLNLINDVLDLAKIEAGKLQISMESVDPVGVIEECLPLVEGMAEKRRISVSRDLTPVGSVRADYTRLRQCVLNFMSNAVKYNRDEGRVSVSLARAADGMIRISVSDTGFGIPKDRMNELFKPFSRLGVEVRQIEGSGIGLALTRDLIGMMDGRVGCDSEPDKGSTFWLELPMVESVAAAEPVAGTVRAGALSAGPLRLLYIEDNPANIELVRMIAQQANFGVETAHTGELGLEAARQMRPDVILLDINLPGIDGYEVLHRLRGMKETAHIPVVGLSALATRGDIERAGKAGFFRYLTKPVKVPELVETLAAATGKRKA